MFNSRSTAWVHREECRYIRNYFLSWNAIATKFTFLIIIVHCGFSETCEKFGLFSLSTTEPDKFNVRHPVVLSAFTNSTCTQI